MTPTHHDEPSTNTVSKEPTNIDASNEPAKPSHVFLGLMRGASGCLPSRTPAAYPPVSLAMTHARKVTMRAAPLSAARIREVNEPSSAM